MRKIGKGVNHEMKQQIIGEIMQKLSAQGLPVLDGSDTDITVNMEFLDIKWLTGRKKISYETAIMTEERNQVIYMFEKTTESGQGLSFDMSNDTSVQSGSTLFRNLRGVHYGPDGKACEYEIDLGAVPKAVKETAHQYGWKFKTVMSRRKASYPRKD